MHLRLRLTIFHLSSPSYLASHTNICTYAAKRTRFWPQQAIFSKTSLQGGRRLLSSSVENELERAAQKLSSLNQRKEMVRTEVIKEDEEERTSQKRKRRTIAAKAISCSFVCFSRDETKGGSS